MSNILRRIIPLLMSVVISLLSAVPLAKTADETPAEPAPPERQSISGEVFAHFSELTYATWAPDLNWGRLRSIYLQHKWKPLWLHERAPNEKAKLLLDAIIKAHEHALLSEEYHEAALRYLWAAKRDISLARLDLLLTDAFLRFSVELRAGYQYPRAVDHQWYMPPVKVEPAKLLQSYLDTSDPETFLQHLAPQHEGYQQLRQVMLTYQQLLHHKGEWKTLPPGPYLKLGSWGYDVLLLRQRLLHEGYPLDPEPRDEYLFDRDLDQQVRLFQRRYGHIIDGIVGKRTRRSLNITLAERIVQIQHNMERWRWLPYELGSRYVMVNMAGYRLQYIENNRTQLAMRVIIGKPFRATPAFSNTIKHLVLNPVWNIPPRIAREDLLPKIKQNPEFLQANHIRVYQNWKKDAAQLDPDNVNWDALEEENFHFKLAQAPGEHNSLGRIKFMFPNSFRVYLHDTPSRELFNRRIRTFSSGCIRVERPISLAKVLLRDQKTWSKRSLREHIRSGETLRVDLKQEIPIYLLYWTAWVDEDGIHFRDDIYQRNQRIIGVIS